VRAAATSQPPRHGSGIEVGGFAAHADSLQPRAGAADAYVAAHEDNDYLTCRIRSAGEPQTVGSSEISTNGRTARAQ